MRSQLLAAGCAALLLRAPAARAERPDASSSSAARAERPDAALGVVLGTATAVGGFLVGGTLVASGDDAAQRAGWLALQAGLALAPFAAHAVHGEWSRGAWFAVPPIAVTGASVAVLASQPAAISRGNLDTQRVLWGLLTGSVLVAALGVYDAAGAEARARRVALAPTFDGRSVGLALGGAL